MTGDLDRTVKADVANMAALIERVAADLALPEEPSGFAVVLDEAAGNE